MSSTKANILLVGISLLFSLAMAEGVIRISHALEDTSGSEKAAECKSEDAYFEECEHYGAFDSVAKMRFYSKAGYRPLAGWKGRGVAIDQHGLRTDKDVAAIAQNGLTIISGGSTAFGANVKQSDAFAERITDAASAGVGGYIFSNESSYVRDFVADQFAFKRWVAFSGWNDVANAYRGADYYRSPDMFELERLVYYANDKVPSPNRFLPRLASITSGDRLEYGDYGLKLYWLLDKLKVKLGIKKLEYTKELVTTEERIVSDTKPMDYARFLKQLSSEILLVHDWSKRNGVTFVFVFQPTIYATDKPLSAREREIVEYGKTAYPGLGEHFIAFYAQLRKDLPALAAANGFTYIDADAFIRGGSADETFFVDHVHFGAKGNKAIADGLAKALGTTAQ